jgi:hypothetical protein
MFLRMTVPAVAEDDMLPNTGRANAVAEVLDEGVMCAGPACALVWTRKTGVNH